LAVSSPRIPQYLFANNRDLKSRLLLIECSCTK
jgi:hypothetical protein